ncbi:MAG: nucleoside monophosphate kinase [Candidatus Pacebacteria bacterium]|nr:nucleoside monophosphate kinase [Candidatus Paceibacterota bacterium]
MDKKVIILFGPPGAGKGTQAELLSDKMGLYLFETSKILEEKFNQAENLSEDSLERFIEIDSEKYDILNEKKLWKEGILCSPPFVAHLVKEKIKELAGSGKNLVIAGSPRTLFEAERITPILKELYGKENIRVVLIEISPEATIFRNSHRKICELMRHPILYNQETENLTLCPLDGSRLLKREGLDDKETIKVRLKEYQKRTFPVIDYLEKENIEVDKINGEKSVADVFEDIMSLIK